MAAEWDYAVTFESESQPPETLRGEVAGRLSAAVARAVRLAKQQKPTRNHYESLAVLLERRRASRRAAGGPQTRRKR